MVAGRASLVATKVSGGKRNCVREGARGSQLFTPLPGDSYLTPSCPEGVVPSTAVQVWFVRLQILFIFFETLSKTSFSLMYVGFVF